MDDTYEVSEKSTQVMYTEVQKHEISFGWRYNTYIYMFITLISHVKFLSSSLHISHPPTFTTLIKTIEEGLLTSFE